jgi:23S rRNA pseudouridine2457 synthase
MPAMRHAKDDSLLILFNKPYGVISQFSPSAGHRTLSEFISVPKVYPAGRLDTDSEGLLLLTDDGALQSRLADPRFKQPKTYWAQVEGEPAEDDLKRLRSGLDLGDFVTRPCEAKVRSEPEGLWLRDPPIRYRRNIPTTWLELVLREGKNRQVRRMTAKIGYPTLRLIRWAIGEYDLNGLQPGQWREAPYVPPARPTPEPRPRQNKTAPKRVANGGK